MNKAEAIALSKIRSRKLDNELKVEALLAELRQDGQFASAENERDTIGFKIAKMRYQKKDLGNLNADYERAKKLMIERLCQLGHQPEELTPAYACDLCKDSGFVDGKLCDCVKTLAYQLLKDNCKTLLTDMDTFNAIDDTIIPEADRERYRISAVILGRFADKFPHNKSNILMLSGKQGTGKTYLMSVLANAIMKKRMGVLFYNSVQLNEIFLRYHLAPIEEKENLFAPLVEADFLAIDDLGAENLIKNVTETYLYAVLVLRESKLTGITTNMSPSHLLERYGHRIASRLCAKNNSYIIHFEGTDLRFQKK